MSKPVRDEHVDLQDKMATHAIIWESKDEIGISYRELPSIVTYQVGGVFGLTAIILAIVELDEDGKL